jgi:2-phosphosulpholactate phosphatase
LALRPRGHRGIRIESPLEGAARARGAVATIDVFRAFTSAAVVLAEGAERMVMVGTVEDALALRTSGVGAFCIGEVGGKAPPGFDLGNSPFEILDAARAGTVFCARPSSSAPAPAPRESRRRNGMPTGSMPHLSSPPPRPRVHCGRSWRRSAWPGIAPLAL